MAAFFGPAESGHGSFDEFLARYLQGERAAGPGHPIDITRLLSRRTHDVLARAAQFAAQHGHIDVDALHILRVMVETEPAADDIRARRRGTCCHRHGGRGASPGAGNRQGGNDAGPHAVGPARAVPRLPGGARIRLDLHRSRAPLLRARARPGHPRRAGAGARRRDRRRPSPRACARPSARGRRDRRGAGSAGSCRGIRHPDARHVRHRPHRAAPRTASSTR